MRRIGLSAGLVFATAVFVPRAGIAQGAQLRDGGPPATEAGAPALTGDPEAETETAEDTGGPAPPSPPVSPMTLEPMRVSPSGSDRGLPADRGPRVPQIFDRERASTSPMSERMVRLESSPLPQHVGRTTSYAIGVVLVDLVGTGIGIAGLATSGTLRTGLLTSWAAIGLAGGPIVHWAHDNEGGAGSSIAARSILMGTGVLSGLMVEVFRYIAFALGSLGGTSVRGGDIDGTIALPCGMIGYVAAWIVDASQFARVTVMPGSRSARVALTPPTQGLGLALSGSF